MSHASALAAPTVPRPVKLYLAAREMRLHHYLWHGARNGWLMTFRDETKRLFREIGWEPPRPSLEPDGQGGRRVMIDNVSGEDFLYMHRQMIAEVNRQLADIGDPAYPKVEGWSLVPPPDNPDYPVPPPFVVPDDPGFTDYIRSRKSDEYYSGAMVELERRFNNRAYFGSVSLGRLGAEVEFTLHNAMHIRWCSAIKRIRPEPAAQDDPRGVPPEWDDPAYDWLGDTYSSHVNDVFWKLHGWVDRRIDLWAEANGVEPDEIEWKGTWEGPHGHAPKPHPPHGPHTARIVEDAAASRLRLTEMERVVAAAGAEIPAGFPTVSL